MKRQLAKIAAAFLVLVSAAGTATLAQAQNFTVLHTFTDSPDGAVPFAGLLIDAAGNLYGTTLGGGCGYVCGTVFKVDPVGNETVLYRFGSVPSGFDPTDPYAAPVMDAAGNLYGTTRDSGAFGGGTVFRLDTSGNLTVLHSFNPSGSDGANPYAGLVLDTAGNLYGTATASVLAVYGTVFKIDTAGNFTILHTFAGADGAGPTGDLMINAGNLYGTTGSGGAFGFGTVFKLNIASGAVTVLYSFGGIDGDGPTGDLIIDAAGNLYGTTIAGGTGTCTGQLALPGCGTVFKLNITSGAETILYSFQGGSDGALPYGGLVMDAAGSLYGTTSEGGPGTCTGRNQVVVGCGIVFKLDPSGNETVLHSFTGGSDGAFPLYGHLVMDTTGNLYGTASNGGFGTTNAGGPCTIVGGLGGCGTVFKLTVKAPAPTITSISPSSAIAGGAGFTLTVNGTNFVSGSTVNFSGSGVATTFVSSTQLAAAIPASDIAITGTVNVTASNSVGVTSNAASFMVVTPQDATGAIINSVNALFGQGVINGGQDNSLLAQLQHAITMMNAGKNAGAIGNLQSFISEVNDLLSSGVLSPSQAASLINAARAVIAPLS